jgi:hypothetical protein
MIIETIIAALVPVAAEGIKSAINKWTGGVKPLNIDEQIKLDQSEISKLEAVAKLDNPGGTPSQWVIDLRASARYVAAGVVILGAIAVMFTTTPVEIQKMSLEAANIVFGFLFGSRIVANFKRS